MITWYLSLQKLTQKNQEQEEMSISSWKYKHSTRNFYSNQLPSSLGKHKMPFYVEDIRGF
jgi:hypothetical protein